MNQPSLLTINHLKQDLTTMAKKLVAHRRGEHFPRAAAGLHLTLLYSSFDQGNGFIHGLRFAKRCQFPCEEPWWDGQLIGTQRLAETWHVTHGHVRKPPCFCSEVGLEKKMPLKSTIGNEPAIRQILA